MPPLLIYFVSCLLVTCAAAPYSDHGKIANGTAQSPTAPRHDGSLPRLSCDPRFCAPYTVAGWQNLTGEAIAGVGGHVTGGRAIASGKGFAAAFAGGSGSH